MIASRFSSICKTVSIGIKSSDLLESGNLSHVEHEVNRNSIARYMQAGVMIDREVTQWMRKCHWDEDKANQQSEDHNCCATKLFHKTSRFPRTQSFNCVYMSVRVWRAMRACIRS